MSQEVRLVEPISSTVYSNYRRFQRSQRCVRAIVRVAGDGVYVTAANDVEHPIEQSVVVGTHVLGPGDGSPLGISWLDLTGHPLRILYKQEYNDNPILRSLFNTLGAIAIDPNGEVGQVRKQLRNVDEAIKDGYSIGVFANGEHTFHHEIPLFEPGAIEIANRYVLPIHPVGIFADHCHPKGLTGIKALRCSLENILQPITVHIGEKIKVDFDRKDKVQKLAAIQQVHEATVGAYRQAAENWRHRFVV